MSTLKGKRLVYVWIVAAWMAAGGAFGAEITLEQAETAVGNWAARGGGFGTFAGTLEVSGETFEDPGTGAKMHVVRVPGKGFAVTSADDGIEPIILFAEGDGEFVAEEGNPLWDLLRWDLAAREKALGEGSWTGHAGIVRKGDMGGTDGVTAQEKWAELLSEPEGPQKRGNGEAGIRIWSICRPPLLKTSWNQTEGSLGSIYNMYTPGKSEVTTVQEAKVSSRAPEGWVAADLVTNEVGHYPVGCVAVAGGQVMNFWQYPTSAVPAMTVTCRVDGVSRPLVFHGTRVGDDGHRYGSYEWNGMGGSEPGGSLPSERVSRLLSDIGVMCGAHYAATGTSMAVSRLASELKSTYGYANAVWHTENLSGGGLKQVLIPNLDAGAPVVLGIGHAHAVVADGYGFNSDESTFYVHINLGWGQSTHYWYVPPDIDRYSGIDEILCNVFPDFTGVVLSGRVTGPHNRPVCKMNMVRSGTTAGAAETGTDGIYRFLLSPGSYQVAPLAPDGTAASSAKSVALTAMSQTANGNRILDFQAQNVMTVGDIAVGTFSPRGAKGASTTFSEPFSVTLSCPTDGCEIHYTLDGSVPRGDGPVYEGPIAIYDTTTLRAVAFAEGMECSDMLEITYNFVDSSSRDNFADARSISGASGRSGFNNAGCTREDGEPQHGEEDKDGAGVCWYEGGASVWASWTAPADGDWTFWLSGTGTNGTQLTTFLAVYTGDEVGKLTRVVPSSVNTPADGIWSRLSFHATAGTEYKIAMDTYDGDEGILTLRWEEGYVHWVEPASEILFVPKSGGHGEIAILSSANWRVVEHSDQVTPETQGGANKDIFPFTMTANGTGRERTGTVTFQAGSSELETLTLLQHPSMDFATTREEALDWAWRENKRILLVKGRETCSNTRGTLFSSIPSATVKPLVDEGYVLWYSNCDRQSDAYDYTAGGSYYLPVVCILDPLDMTRYVTRTMGYQSASELNSLLSSQAAWAGLPVVKFGVTSLSATSAAVTTKVRAWGAGASSATVTLETGSDAAFTSVKSTRTLGTVSQTWTEQAWTFGPPSDTESAFCRLRVTSGDWSLVSDTVEFVPLSIALDNAALSFTTDGETPWLGQTVESHDGVDAAKCANPPMDTAWGWASSMLKTAVRGPGRLSFWWKTDGSIHGGVDFIQDGTRRDYIRGDQVWQACSRDFADTNLHEVAWEIWRYELVAITGCVDQVTWTPGSLVALDWSTYCRTVVGIQGEPLPTIPSYALPTRTGYTFGGYYDGADGTGTQYYSASGESVRQWDRTGDASLYAKWIPNTYTVTLDLCGGTGGATSATATYGEKLPPLGGGPTRAGWDFFGYFSGTNGTGAQYYNAAGRGTRAWTAASNTTLYAWWQEKADVVWGYRIEDGKAIVTNATPARGGVEIPATLGGCPVGGIGYQAFYFATNLTGLVVPEGIASIGGSAFYRCANLASIAIPDGVVEIGDFAFSGCGLGIVAVPASVTTIGRSAFGECAPLTAIEVASANPAYASVDGVLFSKDGKTLLVFPGGKAGTYTIPAGVENISEFAFCRCGGLTSVDIPKGVTNIGGHAFYECSQLSSLTIPGSVRRIENNVFGACYSLGSLVIPDSVEEIWGYALDGCYGLKRLEVPGAWWGTANVATAQVPSGCEVVYRGIDPLAVVTEALPAGMAGKGYLATLTATGGIAPYTWSEAVGAPAETSGAATYAETGTAKGWQADDSCWNLALPFAFPYFGHSYTNAKVNSNGAISFGTDSFTAYTYREETFKDAPIIAALWKDLSTEGGDIHVTSGADAVTVRWSGTYYNGGAVNFSATLHRSGKIVLSYGAGNASGGTIGLSAGDGVTTVFSAKSNGGSMENADDIVFTPGEGLPPWLALSAGGVLTGTPPAAGEYRVPVAVADSKGVTAVREFALAVLEPCQVTTFKGNGGTPTAQKTTNEVGAAYGTMPTPKKSGYAFLGWFTMAEGGVEVTAADMVTAAAARTLYAHWTDQQVTTFLGNGGTPATQATTNTIYGKYAFPPEPTWGGHAFQGWYNAAEGGKRVYTNSTVTLAAVRTLYAHWSKARGFAITAFAVGLDGREEGGAPQTVPGEEQAETVCRIRFAQSGGKEYEIQWTASMDGEWETVERLAAETDGEGEVEIEVSGGEKGFFRVVASGDAGKAE